jgi:hypothetical protein
MHSVVLCPECGCKVKVADSLIGKRVKCPRCSKPFPVEPELEDSAPPQSAGLRNP